MLARVDTSTKPASTAQKRKSDGPPEEQTIDLDSFDCEGMPIDKGPAQVRRQIRTFLDNGGMKIGEFCDAIGVSNHSLNMFLGQKGDKGSGSHTFDGAWEFFKKREMAGLKMPGKSGGNKRQKTDSAAPSAGGKARSGPDVSEIYVPGEESGDVAVYDTCDEIRKKMNAHFKKDSVTKAQFARDLQAQMPAHATTKIQGSQVETFRNKKGARSGCTSSVYAVSRILSMPSVSISRLD